MAKRAILPLCLLAPLALLACSGKPSVNIVNNNMAGQPPAAAAAAAAAPAASTAAGPVTTFDGEWGLRFTSNPSTAKQCPPPPSRDVVLAVDQGRAQLNMGKTYSGPVNAGGEVRIADRMDRSIAILGAFQGENFVGQFRNGTCSYAVAGRKRVAGQE
jgi:hypothetical protein